MRIVLVQDFLRVGGTERQTVALANAFAAAGHEVLVVTFRPGGPLVERVAANVRHVSLQRDDTGLDWFAPGLVRALREFSPDIVQLMGRMAHVHGWRIVRALPNARVVATLRTGKKLPFLYRVTLRRTSAIVANSHEAARRVGAIVGSRTERVHVIHNAVAAPEPAAPATREDLRRETGTSNDAVVFICVAMMRAEKGHRELVRVASLLESRLRDRAWELWLAGDGEELEPCRALARELGAEKRVRFLGRRDDVNRLLAAADIALLASRSESLPNFLVEAQWCGLPVAAYDTGGVAETFAQDDSGILVPPGDVNTLADAAQRLATDAGLRARMSAAAREHARAHFDPARQNQRYLDLFVRLLARMPPIAQPGLSRIM